MPVGACTLSANKFVSRIYYISAMGVAGRATDRDQETGRTGVLDVVFLTLTLVTDPNVNKH